MDILEQGFDDAVAVLNLFKRLLGALLMEKDEAWSTDRQYFDMRAYVEWKQEQTAMITNELQQAAVPAC